MIEMYVDFPKLYTLRKPIHQTNLESMCIVTVETRYPLSIHFESISEPVQNADKVIKVNLRITSKSHAHLQNMIKTSVQFQKDKHKMVGGVTDTRYIPSEGAEV